MQSADCRLQIGRPPSRVYRVCSAIVNRQSSTVNLSFTLIEMLVVLGIIGLVAALSLPMLTPFMRGRRFDQATDAVKSACIVARSKAVQQRRTFSVTLLEVERKIIINDYVQLKFMLPIQETGAAAATGSVTALTRQTPAGAKFGYYVTLTSGLGAGQQRLITADDGTTLTLDSAWTAVGDPMLWNAPAAGDGYIIGGPRSSDASPPPVCPHFLGNFSNDPVMRDQVLTTMAVEKARDLPEGCRFVLNAPVPPPPLPPSPPTSWNGLTYIFLPTGGAWMADTDAMNDKNTWYTTTHVPPNPDVYGPHDYESVKLIVYAMTGQAVAE